MIKNIFLIILFLSFGQFAFAQEKSESSDMNWDYLLYNYNKNQIDKPVKPEEYQKALETVTNYQKKSQKTEKKQKKTGKKDKNNTSINPEKKKSELSNSLLRLPIALSCDNKILKQGFYLVTPLKKDSKYFLILQQNENVAEIEAKVITEANGKKDNSSLITDVTVETADNNSVKINYKSKDLILESVLPIYSK